MSLDAIHWISLIVLLSILLVIDLWKSNQQHGNYSPKQALLSSLAWISVGLLFNVWVYFSIGAEAGTNFLLSYLLEKSLSIDNLFVFMIIFAHFKVPNHCKHKVLFFGIFGALVMRGLMIWAGLALIETFWWSYGVMGLFLIYTGIKFCFHEEVDVPLEERRIHRFLESTIGYTSRMDDGSFFLKENNQWKATPLLLVVLFVEVADLIFAIDSIPAVMGITTDPFIVFSSNAFAILGLRSLFFVVEGWMKKIRFLHYILAGILILIGIKMVLHLF